MADREGGEPVLLRQPRAGDFGWVVSRHGAIYAAEYGFSMAFEGLVANVVAAFIKNFDAERERCWIAERARPAAGAILPPSRRP
ncbi:MAG TPA: hypothetical protein VME41_10610 [Stellaceae bacterium]|nr:hypothetical protein [Stellaceae bacterium]